MLYLFVEFHVAFNSRIDTSASLIAADEVFPPFFSGTCMFRSGRKARHGVTINFAWQGKYTEALLELSREEMPGRIRAAEQAIYQRLDELKHGATASHEELWALSDALRGLRMLDRTECSAERLPGAGTTQRQVAS
jgi:hypothetical protein